MRRRRHYRRVGATDSRSRRRGSGAPCAKTLVVELLHRGKVRDVYQDGGDIVLAREGLGQAIPLGVRLRAQGSSRPSAVQVRLASVAPMFFTMMPPSVSAASECWIGCGHQRAQTG